MSKSSSVTSVKYRKLFLGIIISIVFGIAGAVIWIFGESGVRMNGSMKDLAMVFFAVEGIPAVVFYIIWYLKDAKKRLSAAGEKIRNKRSNDCKGECNYRKDYRLLEQNNRHNNGKHKRYYYAEREERYNRGSTGSFFWG